MDPIGAFFNDIFRFIEFVATALGVVSLVLLVLVVIISMLGAPAKQESEDWGMGEDFLDDIRMNTNTVPTNQYRVEAKKQENSH